MDTVFTSDRVPVIWHDHSIQADKCRGKYVGKFIAELTLEQVKTLDCSVPLANHPQQVVHTPTRIATLVEVLELIQCYDDPDVRINLETKLDPTAPHETLPMETYVTDLLPLLGKHGFLGRTTIQSFDWRTLVAIRDRYPQHPDLVALVEAKSLVPDAQGAYPWLGGLNLAHYGGD
ncbi:PLC-like phosphodiesterase [Pseudovirgaria hyperparasitica]|uniref:PLC-like phosphodiesterase n=1 Tax=Pseudovirgaria hyperparasitica TaxID=470096 RepID=A0A6A6W013_9PEZI|nr:PLC-like phosphodiesterase [Pseudovirgaria hyperparasitica]KAF2756268.1 PLC-like phosphodiesterase [Pseudovirgaria hyperparasitica]